MTKSNKAVKTGLKTPKLASRRAFESWLRKMKPNAVAGIAGECDSCALANFYQKTYKPVRVAVDTTNTEFYFSAPSVYHGSDYKLAHRVPKSKRKTWHARFVKAFDKFGEKYTDDGTVTAKDTLSILYKVAK